MILNNDELIISSRWYEVGKLNVNYSECSVENQCTILLIWYESILPNYNTKYGIITLQAQHILQVTANRLSLYKRVLCNDKDILVHGCLWFYHSFALLENILIDFLSFHFLYFCHYYIIFSIMWFHVLLPLYWYFNII